MFLPEFQSFPKIGRLNREVVVTEKLDGTNAQVYVSDDGTKIHAGSRNRWITLGSDNYGFARFVDENRDELLKLGPGLHYGEWWGSGIQRTYGLTEKRFSLFNVHRWGDEATRPKCCGVVPLLWKGLFEELPLGKILNELRENGSVASPGFAKPEGIVIFHTATSTLFKKTLEDDHAPKGAV